jgi:anti-anti-sigma regulatory factor
VPDDGLRTIAIHRALGRVVVAPSGKLSRDSTLLLRTILGDLVAGQGNLELVIDAMDVVHMHAEVITVLSEIAVEAAARGAVVVVSLPPDDARAELERAGVKTVPRPGA